MSYDNSNSNSERGQLIQVCGLWAGKEGSRCVYSGTWGGVRMLLMRNDRKEPGSKQPDLHVCFAKAERKPGGTSGGQQGGGYGGAANSGDDIPF